MKVYTLEHDPVNYAWSQINLGFTHHTLASLEDEVENCKEAIKAYKESLKVYTKEEFPENHQWVQSSLKELLDFSEDK